MTKITPPINSKTEGLPTYQILCENLKCEGNLITKKKNEARYAWTADNTNSIWYLCILCVTLAESGFVWW